MHQSTTTTALSITHCITLLCSSSTSGTLAATGNDPTATIGSDGLGVIASTDPTGELRISRCTNIACTSTSTTSIATVPLAGVDASGVMPSITVGPDGMPIIAHNDAQADGLRVTHCSDLFCIPFQRRR